MMFFAMRFDLRNPDIGGITMAERYQTALEMAEWADRLGCVNITVSEHHTSPDGYLPSPIPMLAAMAARTTNVRFMIAALIAPFYNQIRLAEDLITLDILSQGRVDVVVAGGYVHEEFAMYDVPMSDRGKIVTETIATLRAAFAGEPFEYRGRTVHITPAPFRPGGPGLSLGGSTEVAARRAARLELGFIPSMPEIYEFYRDEVQALGRPDPGPTMMSPNVLIALAEDPEAGWEEMSPYFMHETNAYGAWIAQDNLAAPYSIVTDTEALRASGQYRVITPEQLIEEAKAAPFPFVMFHPMCGGMPPELAWKSLKLFEEKVLPAFAD